MVGFLLDTRVISELRRRQPDRGVQEAIDVLPSERLFISVVSIGELAKGVALLPDGQQKRDVSNWLLRLEHQFDSQILPIDVETVYLWGELTARSQLRGIHIPATDGLIAATARHHGLQVMTRNTEHFQATGAFIVDPWSDDAMTQDTGGSLVTFLVE